MHKLVKHFEFVKEECDNSKHENIADVDAKSIPVRIRSSCKNDIEPINNNFKYKTQFQSLQSSYSGELII